MGAPLQLVAVTAVGRLAPSVWCRRMVTMQRPPLVTVLLVLVLVLRTGLAQQRTGKVTSRPAQPLRNGTGSRQRHLSASDGIRPGNDTRSKGTFAPSTFGQSGEVLRQVM